MPSLLCLGKDAHVRFQKRTKKIIRHLRQKQCSFVFMCLFFSDFIVNVVAIIYPAKLQKSIEIKRQATTPLAQQRICIFQDKMHPSWKNCDNKRRRVSDLVAILKEMKKKFRESTISMRRRSMCSPGTSKIIVVAFGGTVITKV